VIKILFGCTRDFRVKMWGTSLPEEKLAGCSKSVLLSDLVGGTSSVGGTVRPSAFAAFRLTVVTVCKIGGSHTQGAKAD
jgi:hypothetical protein